MLRKLTLEKKSKKIEHSKFWVNVSKKEIQ